MKVLVTGGIGYIGSNLTSELVKKGYNVNVIDDLSNSNPFNVVPGANYVIKNTANLKEDDLKDVAVVFHLAEYSRVAPSFEEISKVFESNIRGSFNVLELCRKKEVPIIYGASSTKLCAEGAGHSPYSFFKSTIVDLIRNYGTWYGLRYSICYFYNVYGRSQTLKHDKWDSVVSIFNRQMSEGKPLTIAGDGLQERDFTFVGDIVDGIIKSSEKIDNDEYQLGSGVKYSILELAKMFGGEIIHLPERPGDRKVSLANNTETKKKLNWKPKMNLKSWIEEQKLLRKLEEGKSKKPKK